MRSPKDNFEIPSSQYLSAKWNYHSIAGAPHGWKGDAGINDRFALLDRSEHRHGAAHVQLAVCVACKDVPSVQGSLGRDTLAHAKAMEPVDQ